MYFMDADIALIAIQHTYEGSVEKWIIDMQIQGQNVSGLTS